MYYSQSITQLAKLTYPTSLKKSQSTPLFFSRLKFAIKAMKYHSELKYLQKNIEPNILNSILKINPSFFEKVIEPFLKTPSSVKENIETLISHHQFLFKNLNDSALEKLYIANNIGITLLEFEIKNHHFKLMLSFDIGFKREGSLTLKLLKENNHTFYSITFVIKNNKQRSLIIGGLQGPVSNDENRALIKILTRGLHGLRPKDLMIKFVRMVALTWQVNHILAITNDSHIYQAKYRKRNRVKADYDQYWESINATKFSNEYVELNRLDPRKPIEEVTQSKRTMYRRRYEWLDNTTEIFTKKLALKNEVMQNIL